MLLVYEACLFLDHHPHMILMIFHLKDLPLFQGYQLFQLGNGVCGHQDLYDSSTGEKGVFQAQTHA